MTAGKPKHRRFPWRVLKGLTVAVLLYVAVAYLLMPRLWSHHEHQPGLAAKPAVTTTPSGIPGGPLNVGLVGDKADVIMALAKAGWYPADPIMLKSSLEIASSVVFDRPYAEAPVSTPPEQLANPPIVEMKNGAWKSISAWFGS